MAPESSRLPVRPPSPESFTSALHSPRVAARVGLWLGIAFGVCFLTGLISHYAQEPAQPVPFPSSPSWGYRVTQGLHVTTGIAAVPLLLVKLWTVYPLLFERLPSLRPLGAGVRRLAPVAAERGSIAVLVAGSIFQLATGLMNSAQWYPWEFSFRSTHYAVAWLTIGALLVHVAVKLPLIRESRAAPVEDQPAGADEPSRRSLLRATGVAAAVAVLATAGSTVPALRRVSVLGVRSGDGPQGVPVNRSAEAAGVTGVDPATYRLVVARGDREVSLSLDALRGMEQVTEDLPIACVEGWSAMGTWTGVRLKELVALVGGDEDAEVVVRSLQQRGAFGTSVLQPSFLADDRTLLALALSGAPLDPDHGFPARVIAPNRPGVLQTKWVTRLEVRA